DLLITSFRPLNDPFYHLASALIPLQYARERPHKQQIRTTDKSRELRSEVGALQATITEILRNNPSKSRLFLFIDQFEELYTRYPNESERARFIDMLLMAVQVMSDEGRYPFSLIISIRDDFLFNYPPLVNAFQDAHLLLGPMTKEELRDAIELPA